MSSSNQKMEYDTSRSGHAYTYVPTQRMEVRSSVVVPDGELDSSNAWANTTQTRRTRTQIPGSTEKEGIYVSMHGAIACLVAVWVFFGGVVIMRLSEKVTISNMVTRTVKSCEQLKKSNGELEAQIAAAQDEVAVLKIATQELNMIAPNKINAISLTAVDTRPYGEDTTVLEVLYAMQQ